MKHTNVEAEEAVLGALMLEPGRVPEIATILKPDAFSDPRNQRVSEALYALSEHSDPIDIITVTAELETRGTLDAVGGRERIVELHSCVTSAAHALYHAGIVAGCAGVRRMLAECHAVVRDAETVGGNGVGVREFLAQAAERLGSAAGTDVADGLVHVGDAARELAHQIAAGPVEGLEGLRTGFKGLDRLVPGMRAGDFIVIAARPAVGKTALVVGMAARLALGGNPAAVALYSLEMNRPALIERIVSAHAGLDHYLIRNRTLSDAGREKANAASTEVAASRLAIDDTPSQTLMSIRAAARRHKKRFGLDIVIVDYLQLVKVKNSENRLQEVSAISRGLKELARELQVPVVAAAQLNRSADTGPDQRPRLSHLRESGSIEADADIVVLLHPAVEAEDANSDRPVEAIVAKNRNGPIGMSTLLFQPRYVRFSERAP